MALRDVIEDAGLFARRLGGRAAGGVSRALRARGSKTGGAASGWPLERLLPPIWALGLSAAVIWSAVIINHWR